MDLGVARYVKQGGVALAYQTVGKGPVDILLLVEWVIPWGSLGEDPRMARFLRRLASFARLVIFDRRGVGQSDPISMADPPTIEQWTSDVISVMDAVGSERAFVVGGDLGGQIAISFAATHPQRVEGLILVNTFPCGTATAEIPWGAQPEDIAHMLGGIETMWGQGYPPAEVLAPSLDADDPFQDWVQRAQTSGASPSSARTILAMSCDTDLCGILPSIRVPTLVMHTQGNRMASVENGRYLASHIPGATYVELPGSDHPICLSDAEQIADEIEELVSGERRAVDIDRVVASVLFTDIVDSTMHVVELGDRRWHALLDEHDELARRELRRFGGREVNTTGDGFIAVFDGSPSAVRCAQAIVRSVGSTGLSVRAGVHTGACEVRDDDLGGLAVHVAARVGSAAGPGEVLVSGVVPGLTAGAGITYTSQCSHTLKGIPGEWELFAAT